MIGWRMKDIWSSQTKGRLDSLELQETVFTCLCCNCCCCSICSFSVSKTTGRTRIMKEVVPIHKAALENLWKDGRKKYILTFAEMESSYSTDLNCSIYPFHIKRFICKLHIHNNLKNQILKITNMPFRPIIKHKYILISPNLWSYT